MLWDKKSFNRHHCATYPPARLPARPSQTEQKRNFSKWKRTEVCIRSFCFNKERQRQRTSDMQMLCALKRRRWMHSTSMNEWKTGKWVMGWRSPESRVKVYINVLLGECSAKKKTHPIPLDSHMCLWVWFFGGGARAKVGRRLYRNYIADKLYPHSLSYQNGYREFQFTPTIHQN